VICDPAGPGAADDDLLVRRGLFWESARRLARLAVRAIAAGKAMNDVPYGHGVSVSSPAANLVLARDPADAVQATRRAFENAGFEVRYTPTEHDDDHHTVQPPAPVTDDIATRFNAVLGRTL
jgi:hypothetical protein